MPRPSLGAAVALLALAASACGPAHETGAGGRMLVERVTRPAARLLDEPARARWCPQDSLLTLIAIGRRWTAGLAVRVAPPLPRSDSLPISRFLGGAGTATVALRAIGGAARLAITGSLSFRAAGRLDGGFDVTVTDTAGPPTRVRGTLTGIPIIVPADGACEP